MCLSTEKKTLSKVFKGIDDIASKKRCPRNAPAQGRKGDDMSDNLYGGRFRDTDRKDKGRKRWTIQGNFGLYACHGGALFFSCQILGKTVLIYAL